MLFKRNDKTPTPAYTFRPYIQCTIGITRYYVTSLAERETRDKLGFGMILKISKIERYVNHNIKAVTSRNNCHNWIKGKLAWQHTSKRPLEQVSLLSSKDQNDTCCFPQEISWLLLWGTKVTVMTWSMCPCIKR